MNGFCLEFLKFDRIDRIIRINFFVFSLPVWKAEYVIAFINRRTKAALRSEREILSDFNIKGFL